MVAKAMPAKFKREKIARSFFWRKKCESKSDQQAQRLDCWREIIFLLNVRRFIDVCNAFERKLICVFAVVLRPINQNEQLTEHSGQGAETSEGEVWI